MLSHVIDSAFFVLFLCVLCFAEVVDAVCARHHLGVCGDERILESLDNAFAGQILFADVEINQCGDISCSHGVSINGCWGLIVNRVQKKSGPQTRPNLITDRNLYARIIWAMAPDVKKFRLRCHMQSENLKNLP